MLIAPIEERSITISFPERDRIEIPLTLHIVPETKKSRGKDQEVARKAGISPNLPGIIREEGLQIL